MVSPITFIQFSFSKKLLIQEFKVFIKKSKVKRVRMFMVGAFKNVPGFKIISLEILVM